MDNRPGGWTADEQDALRRVAMLAARTVAPREVFAAVAAEAGRLLAADQAAMVRYDVPDSSMMTVARWSAAGDVRETGRRMPLGGRNVGTLVLETCEPARIDDFATASDSAVNAAPEHGIGSSVGAPVIVEGRLWGVLTVTSTGGEPLPAGAEARLAAFTELAGTAIANAQARVELRGYAEEQAALRRVATLVAGGAVPEEMFAAVAAEAGRVLGADLTAVARYEPDGTAAVLGAWTCTGALEPFAGTRTALGGQNLITQVFRTCRPVRIDDYGGATGAAAAIGHDWGFRTAVGVPITVEGRLWGVLAVASTCEESLPTDTETRLVWFTELVGTAIANTQARVELRGYADEQAALRRVATLIATAAPPKEVFAAVAEEIGRVLGADITGVERYHADRTATEIGLWTRMDAPLAIAVGDRLALGGRNVSTLVHQTGQPARIDDYCDSSGGLADAARDSGMRASVGVPISLAGQVWGVVTAGSVRAAPMPADTEARLVAFTELIGTAIANAESQAALAASRARLVAAADEARRRIERDLHDGAQQRLVTLAVQLRELQATAPHGTDDLVSQLDEVAVGLKAALEELREIARGIHPAVLAEGGLTPALKALARSCTVPVDVHVQVPGRLPGPVEIAAYYVVCEALTNTAKHAQASVAEVTVAVAEDGLRVSARDDGQGGAAFSRGSGLLGLKDRVDALGGEMALHSPLGTGTTLEVRIPLREGPLRGA
jgi:signal transduction histidine kinase